jgi:hypothetical protein
MLSAAARSSSIRSPLLPQLHRDVDQVAGDVLDQDVQVVGALAVAQGGVDLAGLGVDQERLEELAVPLEQGVGQRAVAPEHAFAVQVDEQAGDGLRAAARGA